MLPIVQRELQVAARSPKLYSWRLRAGLLVILLGAGMALTGRGNWRVGPTAFFFHLFSFLALLYCLLEGLHKCSDAISEEKRQGTLGLLFLTDLKGFDIVLGKLSSAMVRSCNSVLSLVPIMAISLLVGGTTAGEFWRMVLVLLVSLLLSLCVCLLVSALSRHRSIGVSMGALAILTLLPLAAGRLTGPPYQSWIYPLSPLYLLQASSDAYYSRQSGGFWMGAGVLVLISIVSLVIASLALPRAWQDQPAKTQASKRLGGRLSPSPRLLKMRRAMLDRNPVMWLMFNPRTNSRFRGTIWLAAIAAALGMIGVNYILPFYGLDLPSGMELIVPGGISVILVVLTSLHVARESSRNLAEARENGALELILSTPVKVSEIIRGQWMALRAAIVPALFLLGILGGCVIAGILMNDQPFPILVLLKSSTEAVFGFFVIGWAGMWMGLTSKSPARAFFKTIIIGLILPHLVCTPTLVNQLVILVLAADKVKVQFRRLVAERYLQHSRFKLSPIPPGATNTPPVLR